MIAPQSVRSKPGMVRGFFVPSARNCVGGAERHARRYVSHIRECDRCSANRRFSRWHLGFVRSGLSRPSRRMPASAVSRMAPAALAASTIRSTTPAASAMPRRLHRRRRRILQRRWCQLPRRCSRAACRRGRCRSYGAYTGGPRPCLAANFAARLDAPPFERGTGCSIETSASAGGAKGGRQQT
jgi:hypothetical protein